MSWSLLPLLKSLGLLCCSFSSVCLPSKLICLLKFYYRIEWSAENKANEMFVKQFNEFCSDNRMRSGCRALSNEYVDIQADRREKTASCSCLRLWEDFWFNMAAMVAPTCRHLRATIDWNYFLQHFKCVVRDLCFIISRRFLLNILLVSAHTANLCAFAFLQSENNKKLFWK